MRDHLFGGKAARPHGDRFWGPLSERGVGRILSRCLYCPKGIWIISTDISPGNGFCGQLFIQIGCPWVLEDPANFMDHHSRILEALRYRICTKFTIVSGFFGHWHPFGIFFSCLHLLCDYRFANLSLSGLEKG